jgi:hypothetical protein
MQSGFTRCFFRSSLLRRIVTWSAMSGLSVAISRSASSIAVSVQKVRQPDTSRHSHGTSLSFMYDRTVATLRSSKAATSEPRSQRRGWQCPPFYDLESTSVVLFKAICDLVPDSRASRQQAWKSLWNTHPSCSTPTRLTRIEYDNALSFCSRILT